MTGKKNPIRFYSRLFIIGITFLLFISCKKNASEKNIFPTPQQIKAVQPTVVTVSHPIVVSLDTCPKPTVITVPKIEGTSYKIKTEKGIENIKLSPPTKVEAEFYIGMKNYTMEQGLALNAISCSCIDKNGNIWLGTNGGGLSCYDGQSFKNYTTVQGLPSNTIWSVFGDENGNVWIGTLGNGLVFYNGKTFRSITASKALIGATITKILEDRNGSMWFATYNNGVIFYNGKSFKNYTVKDGLISDQIFSLAEDKKGNIWLGTNNGISCFDGKKFINYTAKQGLPAFPVFSMEADNDGNLWIGTIGGGLSCYDGQTFKNYTTKNNFLSDNVHCIIKDEDGNMWFATDGGVSCYNGHDFSTITTDQGLANNTVYSITEGKSGELWFGTLGGGVSRYDGGAFKNLVALHNTVKTAISDIVQDNIGDIWFSTNEGVLRYNGNSFIKFTINQGLAANTIWSLAADKKENIWMGTYGGGVSCFNGKTFTNYSTAQGLAENDVFCIRIDKKGNVWFGTGGGVSCYDGKKMTNYTISQGLSGTSVWSILTDKKGNIWLGTDGGLSCFNGKTFTNYTTANGVSIKTVKCIVEDTCGNIWFGTGGGGIFRYDGKSIINFTMEDGLSNDEVSQLTIDKNQNIIVGTRLGFSILQFKNKKGKIVGAGAIDLSNQNLKKQTPVWNIYNFKTGYPVNDISGMITDNKGIVWAGSADKIIRFDDAAIHKINTPPNVFLQAVKINDATICWNDLTINKDKQDSTITAPNVIEEVLDYGKVLTDAVRDTMRQQFGDITFDSISRFYPVPENLVLPYQHNNVTFNFAAIEPVRPFLVRYQYMLEGYDNTWSPITQQTNATFNNIYEGKYTFKLKAESPEGIWSSPILYKFKVLPPWWRTWWMYAIYIISFLFFIVMIIKWRERKLKKEKTILEEIVNVRTKEVTKQKELVEDKNKEIIDSINYALRLQQAILPSNEHVYDCFPQSFVLYKPKDIVSGDFYFLSKKEEVVFLAAADCTGHGVPGAFMSMLGYERLTDSIQQSSETSEILSLLNKGIKKSLHQSAHETSTRDGMDIAFCSFDFKNSILKYAGANRPLWIIRKNSGEVEEIKATKKAIGGLTEDDQYFETNTIKWNSGDTFYIFTDGYSDQFGGDKNKKLTSKKFKSMLLEIRDKSMNEQNKFLADFIIKWKAQTEQIDDILVIGIRV